MSKKWFEWFCKLLRPEHLEHPVTHRRLSEREIEDYRRQWGLSPEQVERLRSRLPIRLTWEQQMLNREIRPAPPCSVQLLREESTPLPDPARVADYYQQVARQKWRGIPEDMRGGLRVDRWGVLYEKNPRGQGWREKGSEGPFEIIPNASW